MLKNYKSRIKYLLKGLLMAFIITIAAIVGFSILLRFTSLNSSKIQLFNYFAIIFSVLIASIYVAIKIKEKGWIHGGIIGLSYFLVIVILNMIFFKDTSSMLLISRFVISSISGVIGGMIGINLV